MSRRIWAAISLSVGMGIAAAAVSPAAAEPVSRVELTSAQMVETAKLSVRTGNLAQALALADALLLRDSGDVDAHLVRGHALRAQQAYGPAQRAGRAAWRYAGTDNARYNAAMLMAQALSADGKRTRAQLWLRRAVEHAPTPAHAARATRDFRYVRQRNPWQTHLSFTLAPNSNINNGSARDFYFVQTPFGEGDQPISPDQQALSGLEIGAQLQSRYRFHQTERRAQDLRLGLSYRSYALSSSSKNDAPGISGSDYAYGTASIGYGFRQMRRDGRGELRATLDLGQTFYDGARYAAFVIGSLDQSLYLDRRNKLNFGLRLEDRNGQRVSDTQSSFVSLGWDKALESGNGLHLGLSLGEQRSGNQNLAYEQIRLRGGYVLGRELLGAQWQIGLGLKLRDYDAFIGSFDGRRDLELSFDATATFKGIDYYGFSPRVGISAARTNSTIGIYDSNRFGIDFGIVSAF